MTAPTSSCCGGTGMADYAAVPCPDPRCPVPAPTSAPAPAGVTVLADPLRRALLAALAFTDREDLNSATDGVYLEVGGGALTATATNRFTLGHARIVDVAGEWDGRGALIGRRHAQWIADGLAHLNEKSSVTLALVGSTRRLHVEHRDLACTVRNVSLTWLNYRSLFTATAAGARDGSPAVFGMMPLLLRPFAQVQELLGNPPTRWTITDPRKPIRVEIGATFTGLVMPYKLDSKPDPGWPVPVSLPPQGGQR